MPEKVRSFDYIRIKFIKFNSKSIYFRHFDANTLEFLTKITPLLADEIIVGPIIPNRVENLRTILTILAPSLDGIRSMQCANEYTLPVVRQFLSREGFSNKLKKFNLEVFYANETGCLFKSEKIHFPNRTTRNGQFHQELADPNGQWWDKTFGVPQLPWVFRTSFQRYPWGCLNKNFLMEWKFFQEFYAATTPRTFAVNLKFYSWQERQAAEFHLENRIGEVLHGEWTDNVHRDVFQITRHSANRKTEEVREWIEAMTKGRKGSKIWIFNSTIGWVRNFFKLKIDSLT